MKKTAFLVLLLMAGILAKSQTTLTLQPDGTAGKDAWITSNPSGTNFGVYPNFAAIAWSSGGNDFVSRGLIEFDLSGIPSGATITSAKLSLYCNTTSDHPQLHSTLSGSNACSLSRITGSWAENTVTWDNQPTITATHQVTVGPSTSTTQDFPDIDILQLVNDQRAGSSPNALGIMLLLNTEEKYRSLIFANSDHIDPTKRPKLVITYTTSSSNPCVRIRPNGNDGKDAWVTSNPATSNFGVYPNFAAIAWSSGGNNFVSRGLIEFNTSAVPSNATVTSASLSLYCNTTSDHPQLHSNLSGSNACLLQRITGNWDENTVNWNNKPSTTTASQVTLAQSTSTTQDYPNINVLSLLMDQRSTSSPNAFGLMLTLETEAQYRSLIFANSDHADSTKWPVLEVCYALPSGLGLVKEEVAAVVYPNPKDRMQPLTIMLPKASEASIEMFDLSGRSVFAEDFNSIQQQIILNNSVISYLPAGTYLLRITTPEGVKNTKVLLE